MSVSLCFRSECFGNELVVWIKHFLAYQGLTCLEWFENSSAVGQGTCIVRTFVCACVFVYLRDGKTETKWARERNSPLWLSVTPPPSHANIWCCLIYGRRPSVWWLFNATDTAAYTHTQTHATLHVWVHRQTHKSIKSMWGLPTHRQTNPDCSLCLQHWSSMTA